MRVFGYVGGKRWDIPNLWLLPALNGRLPRLILSVIVTSSEEGIADKDAGFAAHSFTRVFREEMVDKWIDSGKAGEVENPWERVAPPLLESFLARNPPALSVDADGPYLILMPQHEGKSLADAVIDGARAMFLQLLDSPACRRLFRCNGCGMYFLRERMPKKDTPIKRGSWCARCKREGRDRIRRTEDGRNERTRQMVRLAADAWPLWRQDRRHGERAEWIARKVNKRLQASWNPIAKNWVTGHKDEIEAELERRRHAKG
jgi:hypothetical protein